MSVKDSADESCYNEEKQVEENMHRQTNLDIPIGDIHYFTEFSGDAPISVYVISGKDGNMLIDTGFSTTYKPLIKWIRENGFHITDIFLTHAHPDHDWNAARLKGLFSAKIWLSEKDVSLIRNFASQPQVPTDKKFGKRVKWITFWTKTPFFKSKAYEPDVIVRSEGSDLLRKYGYDMEIVSLPGHTLGSIGIKKGNVLYCGDAYTVLNGLPMLPPHVTSIELMQDSFEKICRISPEYLACGHGLPIRFSLVHQNSNMATDYDWND